MPLAFGMAVRCSSCCPTDSAPSQHARSRARDLPNEAGSARGRPGRRPGPGQRDELGGGRQKLEFAGVARSAIIAAPAASQRVTDRRTCPLDDGWLRGLPPVCPNAGHRYPGWPPPRLSRQRFRLMVLAFLIILPK